MEILYVFAVVVDSAALSYYLHSYITNDRFKKNGWATLFLVFSLFMAMMRLVIHF